ncbi:Hypothetical protein A7982_04677 [Minicystis rosea]|nr:Hypothetical protein A7982_04677 [Minicystis rosea]
MERAREETSAESRLKRSAFTTAGVGADDDVAGREQGLATIHATVKKAVRSRDDLAEEVQKKEAILTVKDRACDATIEDFELRLLALVRKDRNDPRYRRYFPAGLRSITQADMRDEEPDMVADMLKSMAEDAADPLIGALVSEARPKLSAKLADVETADAALTALEKDLAYLEEKTLPALLATWDDEYKKLHGVLVTAFPRDPARVESYFKPFRKSRAKAKKPVTPSTP